MQGQKRPNADDDVQNTLFSLAAKNTIADDANRLGLVLTDSPAPAAFVEETTVSGRLQRSRKARSPTA